MSNNYFSYVDTALRVIYINTHLKNYGTERISELNAIYEDFETYREVKKDIGLKILKEQLNEKEFYSVLIHEHHHYWQTFYYPFLYYLSWLEFTNLMLCKAALRSRNIDAMIPYKDIHIQGKPLDTLTYTTKVFKLIWDKEGLRPEGKLNPEEFEDNNTFCLIDFLEDATTLFQYKCTQIDPSPYNYYKWVQNPKNKGYKRLYKFLLSKYGKDYAYYLMPVLVQLAFSTTEPIGAFCSFLNMSIYYDIPFESDNNFDLLKTIYLNKYPVEYFDPNNYINLIDTPVTFIDMNLYEKIIDVSECNTIVAPYPLSLHAKKYISFVKTDEKIETYLCAPTEKSTEYLNLNFAPMAVFYNFLDYKSRNNIMIISEDYKDEIFHLPGNIELPYPLYIGELIKDKETLFSLFFGRQANSTPHHCHHEDCAYFPSNLCRHWNALPKFKENCNFPSWFATEFNYEINLKNETIQQISDSEKAAYTKQYELLEQKGKKKKIFNYVKYENIIAVEIPFAVLESNNVEFFEEFIDFLQYFEKYNTESLFGKIILDFDCLKSYIEPIFEIKMAAVWLQSLLEKMPHLFYYLNYDKKHNQLFYLLPTFIRYTKEVEGENLLINLDLLEHMYFIINQIQQVGSFLTSNNLDRANFCDSLAKSLTNK